MTLLYFGLAWLAGIALARWLAPPLPVLGLLVPALESTPTITVQVCIDGTNWYNLVTEDGSTAAISITGGATPFYVSSDVFTPLAAYTGSLQPVANDIKVRLHLSAVQTADRTFTWIGVA